MPTLGPTLETDRLVLRPPSESDLDGWAAFMGDPEATRHLGGVQPRAAVWRMVATMAGSWALRGFGMFSVIERSSGRWVGRLGPWSPEGWPGTEVGWGLARDVWGRGYAQEGATAAIDWAFDHLGWTEVIHCIEPGNEPSVKVAERLGSSMLRRAQLPAPFESVTVDVLGQSREQWRARRSRHPR